MSTTEISEEFSSLSKEDLAKNFKGLKALMKDHHQNEFSLKGDYKWQVKDAVKKADKEILNDCEECYLPDHMKMQVLGAVRHVSWNSSVLLMICEDGQIYAYDDQQLHLVAKSFRQLFNEGITFPSKTFYHYGQAFEDMTEEELKELKASDEMAKAKEKHKSIAEKHGRAIVKAFEEVQKQYEKRASQLNRKGDPGKRRDDQILPRLSKLERHLVANVNLVNQANSFIETAFKLWNLSPNDTVTRLVDEMVHSILFSGHILQIEPDEMFKPEVYKMLVKHFSTALEGFKNKLPRRTPFSCLLELIVEVRGKENRDLVMNELSEITKELDCGSKKQLIGSDVCITQSSGAQQIFSYGASIPYPEKQYKEIWIALSCVHTWHPHVSYAVMKCSRGEPRTVLFPSLEALEASCTTHDAKDKKVKPPCAKCCELFSLQPEPEPNQNPPRPSGIMFGNGAETEAISKLLILKKVPFDDDSDEFKTLMRDTKAELIQKLEKVNARTFNADVVYEPATPATPKS